jgi:2-polyprenyl-3-methyl-5-hydroxy-6-metoxy-1,4-benzoquinol methylase
MKCVDISCPVCGPAPSEKVFEVLSQRLKTKTPFQLRRCSQCGLVITTPRPEAQEMDRLYSEEYFPVGQSSKVTAVGKLTISEETSFVQKYVRQGAVLDIGCGLCAFLMELPAARFEVHGLEPYHGLFASVPESIRPRIKFEPFERAVFPENHFDLITLWHVLEHLPEPVATLQRIHRLLKPGGRLVIEVPNLASVEARWLGRHWYHLDVPFHFWHFTPAALHAMVTQAGLQVEAQHTSTLLRPILLVNYLTMGAQSIVAWAKSSLPLINRDSLNSVLRLLCLPLCLAERFCLCFSTPTMRLVARKG